VKAFPAIAIVSTVAVLAMDSAGAADLPTKAPVLKAPIVVVPSWTGFYIGGGAGFRSSETKVDVTSATDTTLPAGLGTNLFFARDCVQGLPCVTGQRFNGVAGRFSLYGGYNWQIGPRVVVGAEADVGFASQTTTLSGSYYPATPFFNGSTTNSFAVKTGWDASVRGRAGYLVEPWILIYGTAGPSWLHVESTSECSTSLAADGACAPGFPGFAPASITHSTNRLGFTVGGGAEALLWSNWIARAEYRYSNYGTISNTDVRTSVFGTQTVAYDVKVQTHTATFGLAYKFSDPYSAYASAAQPSYFKAPPSVPSWTGFYVGAGVGVRASQTTATLNSATLFLTGGPTIDRLAGCGCFLDDPFDGTAFRVAPYVGFNWQFAPQWVVGIEGDFGFARQKTTLFGNYEPGAAVFGSSGSLNDSYSVKTGWDASLRGRIGYLVTPSFMAYVTGGAAFMSIEETSKCDTALQPLFTAPGFFAAEIGNCTPGLRTPAVITQSTVKPGFTIGGGGEARLWSNWIARAEYRYADFGKVNFTDTRSCAGSATITTPAFGTLTVNCFETDVVTNSLRVRTHTAMFGMAYKFD